MGRAKDPTHTRALLLDAAAAVIGAGGVAALTLDEVARVAQTSKGGLLHHFPTKQALLIGLAEQKIAAFSALLEHACAQEPVGVPGRWARGYIHATFQSDREDLTLTGALVTAFMADPVLLVLFNQAACFLPPDDDGLSAGRLAVIRMACDGLWITELTEAPFEPQVRAAMEAELMELTR